jgi:hypothetical protein
MSLLERTLAVEYARQSKGHNLSVTDFMKSLESPDDALRVTGKRATWSNRRGLATPAEVLVKRFDTQTAVPNAGGIIPSGSIVTFSVWMKKSANFGTMFPRAKLFINNESGTQVCTKTGTTQW